MAWYRQIKAQLADGMPDPQAGPSSDRTERYRGIMVYEVNVPANPDQSQEQEAANDAARELYQRVWNLVGDEVPDYDMPNKAPVARF
tara:strand:+ start:266 stop:526 length:261 start_codon:yes stop_codon:yes gene_type:complete